MYEPAKLQGKSSLLQGKSIVLSATDAQRITSIRNGIVMGVQVAFDNAQAIKNTVQ